MEKISNIPRYSKSLRMIEYLAVGVFLSLMAKIGFDLWIYQQVHSVLWIQLVTSFFISILFADFISGLAHWMADTWFSLSSPVIGPTLIRSFREHHLDPQAITHHDFIETNGATALVCIPVVACAAWFSHEIVGWKQFMIYMTCFLTLFFIFITNQFHKWAHLETLNPVLIILQKAHLLLSSSHHKVHHTEPFIEYYCITNGLTNAVLSRVRFFRRLEKLITRITGMQPRDYELIHVNGGRDGI